MSTLKVTAEVRQDTGKGVARKLRQGGKVPAVLYGVGHDSVSLSLDNYELGKLLNTPGAKTSVLELEYKDEGGSTSKNIIIKEVQMHPYRDVILHMDLLEVDMNELISVMVPIETTGTPKGVRLDGGILEMKRRELEIVCLPNVIPDSIIIDITNLEVGDNVHVEEVVVPDGITIPHDVNFTILTVVAPTVEEEVEEEEVEEGEEAEEEAADSGDDEEE